MAENLDLSSVPAETRNLPLVAAAPEGSGTVGDGPLLFPVGRLSHPDFFEAWLPDVELRNCISRTAFEISWNPASNALHLLARGANPVCVDNEVAARDRSIALHIGSQIGFPYSSAGELAVFLLLRIAASGTSCGGETHVWRLRCVHAEGLAPEELANIPTELRSLSVAGGQPLLVGRQHQPQSFEALLARSPGCLSFISRTHLQVEALAGSTGGMSVTNLSSNPVYVEGEPLAKNDRRSLAREQLLSFARLEGGSHVLFLSLQVEGWV